MEDELGQKDENAACGNEMKEQNGEVGTNETDSERTCEGCCNLMKQVSVLTEELESLKKKIEKTEKLLEKAVFERDSSSKYVESFREQVSQLHEKLAAERKKNENQEKHVEKKEKEDVSTTSRENAESGMDIASSIREAAKDIATSIREAAQQATTSHGFVFDEATGLYYDYNTAYYYDPKTRLYYDCRTGIYYTYNQERGSYEFYSQVAATSNATINKDNEPGTSVGAENISKKTTQTREAFVSEKKEIKEIDLVESGSEDGEIVEVDGTNEESQSGEDELEEKKYPPCIRAMVMQSDILPVGSLILITCLGLTFGRTEGGNNYLQMSDVEVSKEHAKVYYDEKSSEYLVKDLASKNGTFINGSRIIESKQESEGRKLSHGEQLKIGSTIFLLHIHPGNETCDECEPGQVQAQLKAKEMEDEVQITRVVSSANDANPESLRRKELKRLKKRYMLGNTEHEVNSEIASNNAGKYKDRAQTRRKIVGSEAPSRAVIESSASVFKPIQSENKGRLMLEKMGWVDGEGLGKTKTGRTEPVIATVRETGRGLGYGAVKPIDMPHENIKSFNWKKAQDRYNAIGKTQILTSSQASVSMNWVKKTSKPETLDIFADDT